jgi:serine/threonine-protein kinase
VDFGISKVRAAITKLTQASVVMGSPQYMSPEQAQGRVDEIDLRTDEWALASITWKMLAGRCPFTGEDVARHPASVCSRVQFQHSGGRDHR